MTLDHMTKLNIAFITGSRRGWPRKKEIEGVVAGHSLLIVGCADGVDAMARRAARDFGIRRFVFSAQWRELGAYAGADRNQSMVDLAELLREAGHTIDCHAFPDSMSRGTVDCMERLDLAGFYVEVHKLGSGSS